MSTFHITFKEQKQVFEVQDISTLKEKVRSEFHIDEDIRFQLYDKTWDDWVDVEIHQLPQRGKIQIITIPHEDTLPINLTDLSSTNSLFSESYNFSDAPIQIEPPTKNFISSMIQLAHQKESCQSTSQAEDISSASTSSSHSWNVEEDCSTGESDVKRKWLEMKQWPDKFALPRLPVVLEGKLNAERMPNDRERRQIVQTLFDYMAGFTSYPLSAHYSEAVRCLLEKYPFLGKETIPGARPVEYWRMKIMDKFRNERKHMPVEKKRKSSGVTPAKAVDDQQLVDDTASIQRHKKWMQEEARRARQNEVKISQMMEITFQSRRKWIIDEKPTVAELKREFPCLFSQRQILIEMRRITPSIDACHAKDLLMSNLEAYAKYLIDSCQSKKNAKAIVNNYREAIANLTNDQAKEAKVLTALVLVPFYFKGEKLSSYLVGDQEEDSLLTAHPKVCYKGDLYAPEEIVVQAENVLVCTCKSMLDALCCLICTYFAFDMEYPKECKNSLLLAETMLGAKNRTTRSVQSLIQKVLSCTSKV